MTGAVAELCNSAQREVLYRASLIGAGKLDDLAALEAAAQTRTGEATDAREPAGASGVTRASSAPDPRGNDR